MKGLIEQANVQPTGTVFKEYNPVTPPEDGPDFWPAMVTYGTILFFVIWLIIICLIEWSK